MSYLTSWLCVKCNRLDWSCLHFHRYLEETLAADDLTCCSTTSWTSSDSKDWMQGKHKMRISSLERIEAAKQNYRSQLDSRSRGAGALTAACMRPVRRPDDVQVPAALAATNVLVTCRSNMHDTLPVEGLNASGSPQMLQMKRPQAGCGAAQRKHLRWTNREWKGPKAP